MKPFFTYLLRCGDGSYYAGHTDDLESRLRQHEDGRVGYTFTRKPLVLVWQGEFESRERCGVADSDQVEPVEAREP